MRDNYSCFMDEDERAAEFLHKCPTCILCGEKIQDDELFDINGDLMHVSCAKEEFQKWTEDYME